MSTTGRNETSSPGAVGVMGAAGTRGASLSPSSGQGIPPPSADKLHHALAAEDDRALAFEAPDDVENPPLGFLDLGHAHRTHEIHVFDQPLARALRKIPEE